LAQSRCHASRFAGGVPFAGAQKPQLHRDTDPVCASAPCSALVSLKLGVGIRRLPKRFVVRKPETDDPEFPFHPSNDRRTQMTQLHQFANSPVKATSMLGTNVVNPRGEVLGEIKEIVIDPQEGKVAYAVVASGGFLGIGEKLFAIPFSAFNYNVLNSQYVLDIDKERLKAAPGFDSNHWPTMSDETWNRDMYRYYDRSPYWE
jgi:sporulation protein YlmC with PRC-barrel domain